MDNADRKTYETPSVLVSLDALGLITEADGMAVGGCGSHCSINSVPARK